MSKFLTGNKLSNKIREIISGSNVKCAVAYWGAHEFGETWPDRKDVQIICDIVSGSTSGHALEALGAPDNQNLKHIENLHAKVYISDAGVIVGSANASARGLGNPGAEPHLLEAGVFHKPNGKVWGQCIDWFDDLYLSAKAVDADALKQAEVSYRPPAASSALDLNKLSVLEQIMHCPQHFEKNGFGFVFSGTNVTQKDRDEACEEVRDANQDNPRLADAIQNWPLDRVFFRWLRSDMSALSGRFVNIHVGPKDGISVSQHRLQHRFDDVSDDNCGHFYSDLAEPSLSLPDGSRMPTSLNGRDKDVLIRLKGGSNSDGTGIFNARAFAELLRQGFDAVDG